MSKKQRVSKSKSKTTKSEDAEEKENVEKEQIDYSSRQYWDDRYKDKAIEHEWYYSFDILEPILLQARDFQKTDNVLELGCGDRSLIQDFQKFGMSPFTLYAIDFSDTVISDLKKLDTHKNINLQSMDARKLRFADESFQFVIEKGTIDAMLSTNEQEEGIENARKLVSEAIRVLDKNASLVIVSHIQVYSDEFELLMEEVVLPSLESKNGVNWDVAVHSVKDNAGGDEDNEETETKPTGKYGTVYVIRSEKKRSTRGSESTPGEVSFQVFEYSDDEDEGDEEVMCCMPCQ